MKKSSGINQNIQKNKKSSSEINDQALQKQMREVESVIEESKKAINDQENSKKSVSD